MWNMRLLYTSQLLNPVRQRNNHCNPRMASPLGVCPSSLSIQWLPITTIIDCWTGQTLDIYVTDGGWGEKLKNP